MTRAETGGSVRYTVFNAAKKGDGVPVSEGTGIRYVKTRLEEAYGDEWSLSYGPRDNGWEVTMTVPLAGKK